MPLAQPIDGASQAELFRALYKACPLLNGRLLPSCSLASGGAYQAFPHNLGRAYQGAIIVGQDSPQLVRVCFPTDANFPTGTDAGTHILVRATTFGGATAAMTFRAWCF